MTSEKTQDKKREVGEWPQGEEAVSGCTPMELAWPVQGQHNGRTWVWTSAQGCLIHLPKILPLWDLLSPQSEDGIGPEDFKTRSDSLITSLRWCWPALRSSSGRCIEGGRIVLKAHKHGRWGRSSKRHDHRLTRDVTTDWPGGWTRALGGSSPLPLSFDVGSAVLSRSQRLLQGHSLEIMIWCWEHLHDACDWTQWRPLYQLLRFGGRMRGSIRPAAVGDKPCI